MKSFPQKRLSFIYVFGLKILTFNKERLPLNILISNENEALDKNSTKTRRKKHTAKPTKIEKNKYKTKNPSKPRTNNQINKTK